MESKQTLIFYNSPAHPNSSCEMIEILLDIEAKNKEYLRQVYSNSNIIKAAQGVSLESAD